MYHKRNDANVAKRYSRHIRLTYSKAWLKNNAANSPGIFSLPGTSGEYEKEIYSFLAENSIPSVMVAYESNPQRWNETNPLGLRSKVVSGEGPRIHSTKGKFVGFFYVNGKIEQKDYGIKEMLQLGNHGTAPILLDGDFCGYYGNAAKTCLSQCSAGSLVTLTFYCRFRGVDKVGFDVSKEKKVTDRDMSIVQRDAVEKFFADNNMPFTRLKQYEYSNNRSPMVLLVYHLAKNSPMSDIQFEPAPVEQDTKKENKPSSIEAIRRNCARALIKAGQFSNDSISKITGLPIMFVAGLDASAKRYGKHVLDRVES